MAERDRFELDLAAAMRAYLEEAPTEVRPVELARQFATAHPRRREALGRWGFGLTPALAWMLLLAVLLLGLVGGTLLAGSQVRRSLPAVVAPVGQVATCPPGSTPDEPGPADQVRPSRHPNFSPQAFDRRAGKLIVLVGAEGEPGTTVETWTFDVCTNTWTRMRPNREPPLQVGSLVYDVDSDLTIGIHSEDWRPFPETGDVGVWTYDLQANTWTEMADPPPGASLHVYDPVSGLVHATVDSPDPEDPAEYATYDVETDTWTLSQREGGPGYGWGTYDTSVDRLVEVISGDPAWETWLLDPRTGAWTRSGVETPVIQQDWMSLPSIVYDESAKRTVIRGGAGMAAYDAAADRWEILAGSNEAGRGSWVYDPVNQRLLALGGHGDVVAFDLMTREWTVLLEANR